MNERIKKQLKLNTNKISANNKKLKKIFKENQTKIQSGGERAYSQSARKNLRKLNSNKIETLIKVRFGTSSENKFSRDIFK